MDTCPNCKQESLLHDETYEDGFCAACRPLFMATDSALENLEIRCDLSIWSDGSYTLDKKEFFGSDKEWAEIIYLLQVPRDRLTSEQKNEIALFKEHLLDDWMRFMTRFDYDFHVDLSVAEKSKAI